MDCIVAVVGATGLVGREILRILESRRFPAKQVLALASSRSAGQQIPFRGGHLSVATATPEAFAGVHFALFSAGASTSKALAPEAASRGAIVIDNSSAWRMDPDVPLIVPEVNIAEARTLKRGIIANPNCSTIQMVVALKPLHDAAGIKHVVVSTYQAASGKGHAAVVELGEQLKALAAGQPPQGQIFPGILAQNLLMDWKAGELDYSEEELKMVNETRKILGDASILVSPTTVRVPIATSHSESVFAMFHRTMNASLAKDLLRKAPGVTLSEEPYAPGAHPQPMHCAGTDDVFVGRVRDDLGVPNAINMFVVADNLRKGAALNAVQIAERLLR